MAPAEGVRCAGSGVAAPAGVVGGCEDGVANDDGSTESGVSSRFLLTRFSGIPAGTGLSSVCVCWSRLPAGHSDIDYDLTMYAADGPDGAPGTELGRVPLSASGVSEDKMFFHHDLSGAGLTAPPGPFYLGIENTWPASWAFLCSDFDGPRVEPSYRKLQDWDEVTYTPMIRPTLEPGGVCFPDSTTLCVDDQPDDGRFAVSVVYDTVLGGGASGAGRARALASLGIDDGGIFSFTDPGNPELLVKVLDGCGINGHWWVFAAATTTVGYQLRVVDTESGLSRTFANTDQHTAEPVVETGAFPCP